GRDRRDPRAVGLAGRGRARGRRIERARRQLRDVDARGLVVARDGVDRPADRACLRVAGFREPVERAAERERRERAPREVDHGARGSRRIDELDADAVEAEHVAVALADRARDGAGPDLLGGRDAALPDRHVGGDPEEPLEVRGLERDRVGARARAEGDGQAHAFTYSWTTCTRPAPAGNASPTRWSRGSSTPSAESAEYLSGCPLATSVVGYRRRGTARIVSSWMLHEAGTAGSSKPCVASGRSILSATLVADSISIVPPWVRRAAGVAGARFRRLGRPRGSSRRSPDRRARRACARARAHPRRRRRAVRPPRRRAPAPRPRPACRSAARGPRHGGTRTARGRPSHPPGRRSGGSTRPAQAARRRGRRRERPRSAVRRRAPPRRAP